MAVEVKFLKVGSDVLTDLRPGKTRRTIYTPAGQLGPMTAFLLGLGAVVLAPGVARMFTGTTPRAKAREALEDDLTAAKITGEKAKADQIRANIALIAREFDPVSEEQRALKLQATRNALDLAERQETIDFEEERTKAARGDVLFDLVRREREAALAEREILRTERAERQAETIQSDRARRELIEEELDRKARLEEQREREREREAFIPSILGPIGAFSIPKLFPEAIGGLTGRRIFSA